MLWALRYLEKLGAIPQERDYARYVAPLVARNKTSMGQAKAAAFGSYMMGDTSIQMLQYWHQPTPATADELARLVEHTIDHPARELMWRAPGTLLAALRMHQHTGEVFAVYLWDCIQGGDRLPTLDTFFADWYAQ